MIVLTFDVVKKKHRAIRLSMDLLESVIGSLGSTAICHPVAVPTSEEEPALATTEVTYGFLDRRVNSTEIDCRTPEEGLSLARQSRHGGRLFARRAGHAVAAVDVIPLRVYNAWRLLHKRIPLPSAQPSSPFRWLTDLSDAVTAFESALGEAVPTPPSTTRNQAVPSVPWFADLERSSIVIRKAAWIAESGLPHAPQEKRLRVGSLSCAKVCEKNVVAILGCGQASMAAIASRSAEKARAFIDRCVPDRIAAKEIDVTDYETFLHTNLHSLHAVFVPLPTGLRCEWIQKILDREHGQRVAIVSEKPTAPSFSVLRPLLQQAHKHRVLYTDGSMMSHSLRVGYTAWVVEHLFHHRITKIESRLTMMKDATFDSSNIRADELLEPHGALGDLVWYCIRFTLHVLGWQRPLDVTSRWAGGQDMPHTSAGLRDECTVELRFPTDIRATFFGSFVSAPEQYIKIYGRDSAGDELTVIMQPLTRAAVPVAQLTVQHSVYGPVSFDLEPNGFQDRQQWRNVAFSRDDDDLRAHWSRVSARTQLVLDACYESAKMKGEGVRIDETAWCEF